MDFIKIKGYKSIQDIHLDLQPINILIGANGAGKSNFLSFFEFLNYLQEQKLQEYVARRGGQEKFLFQAEETSNELSAFLSFNNEKNAYSFTLKQGDNAFIFTKETSWFDNNPWQIGHYNTEALIKIKREGRHAYVNDYLNNLKKYHFHDTGKNSPFSKMSHVINDSYFLYEEGQNLAAFLYAIRENNPIHYNRIVKTIQSIAPFFSDFFLHPNQSGYLHLQWKNKHSNFVYGANDLSDGTIRFIALSTLFLQPNLPKSIIIDEPELGLHPTAIAKLAGMVKSAAARNCQIIMATQSIDLINHFNANDIVTVDQINGASQFNRLNEENLSPYAIEKKFN